MEISKRKEPIVEILKEKFVKEEGKEKVWRTSIKKTL